MIENISLRQEVLDHLAYHFHSGISNLVILDLCWFFLLTQANFRLIQRRNSEKEPLQGESTTSFNWSIRKTLLDTIIYLTTVTRYIVSCFKFGSFTDNVLSQLDGNQNILVTVYDVTNSSRSLLMYGGCHCNGSNESLLHERDLKLGDPSRKHKMICR